MNRAGRTVDGLASLSRGNKHTPYIMNAKCDFNRTHSSFLQALHIFTRTIGGLSQYRQSMADAQKLSSTSHQAPLPPSGCFERGETLLVKFLCPEAKAFNGHCFAYYMRWRHYNRLTRPKTGL